VIRHETGVIDTQLADGELVARDDDVEVTAKPGWLTDVLK
jgi:hypothetical protein